MPDGPPGDAGIRSMVEQGDASGIVDEEPAPFFDQLRAKLAAMPLGEAARKGR